MADYDAPGQRVAETDQGGEITRFDYDEVGRLTTITDALDQVTSYVYDERKRRDMQGEYRLLMAEAGEDEVVFWITLGFSSPLDEYDALHIVRAKEPDSGLGELYYRHYEEDFSQYDAATSIRAERDGISVELTEEGAKELRFATRSLRFIRSKGLKGLERVRKMLRTMADSGCGDIITA